MAEEKKEGHKDSRPSVEEFAARIVKKLTELLTSGIGPDAPEHMDEIDLPKPCGPETEGAITDIGESGPITKLRRIVVVKPGDVEDISEHKEEVQAQLKRLVAARNHDFDNNVRGLFAAVHRAKTEANAAYQLDAVRILDTLIREASEDERVALDAARRLVLAGNDGDLDAATFRVRQVFASRVGSQNVRLAYTTLATQFGEGYQLCPKAAHQIGRAVPMEISKCRDNCIDSRVTREGQVTCAYADWLRRAADNHKAMEARLEKVEHDLNKETLGTLSKGERSKPDPVKSIEGQMDGVRSKYPDPAKDSLETSLDSDLAVGVSHRENSIKRIQDLLLKTKGDEPREEELDEAREDGKDYDDNTLEQMLEEEHEGIGDDELDLMVEELLERARPEK